MTQKNVALVGAGRWGKNLARNFYDLGALSTICDTNEEILNICQSKYQEIQLTNDFQTILHDSTITRIAIATPTALHYHCAKQALLAGKDVFVEKPLCMDSSEGEELVALAKKNNLILMVGHILHYHPCIDHLFKMVRSGLLGQLHYLVSNRLNFGPIRPQENVLWDLATHDISILLALCGSEHPAKVSCTGTTALSPHVANTAMITMQFNNGIKAHVYVSWLNPFKEQKLILIGSEGMAVFDDTKSWEEKLLFSSSHVTWKSDNLPTMHQEEARPVIIAPQKEPLREECLHFLTCCDKRHTPPHRRTRRVTCHQSASGSATSFQ